MEKYEGWFSAVTFSFTFSPHVCICGTLKTRCHQDDDWSLHLACSNAHLCWILPQPDLSENWMCFIKFVTFHNMEVRTSCYIPSSSGLLQKPYLFIWSYLSDDRTLQKCLNNYLQNVTWFSPLSSLSCHLNSVKYFLSPRHCWHLATVLCQFPIFTIKPNELLKPR